MGLGAPFLGFLLLAARPACADIASSPMAYDTTLSVRGAVPIRIALMRIALIAKPGTQPDTVGRFAAANGLADSTRISESLYVFSLTDSLAGPDPRRALASFARALRLRGPAWLSDVGMVVLAGRSTSPVVATDRFIAQLSPKADSTKIDSLNAAHHVSVLEAAILKPGHYLLSVTDSSDADAIEMANVYGQSGLMRYSHPNWIRTIRFHANWPNDKLFPDQWYHENTGQGDGTPDADMDTPLAWKIMQGSLLHLQEPFTSVVRFRPIVIALIDGGFEMTHPDLSGVLWQNPIDNTHGVDFTDGDENDHDPSPDPCPTIDMLDIHGTMVAGLAGAAFNNGEGIAGACPSAKLMLVRIKSAIEEEVLAKAFNWARTNGATVISCSWGVPDWDPLGTHTLREEIDEAVEAGTVILFAVDYHGTSGCEIPDDGEVLADNEKVIPVGAVSNEDRRLPVVACGNYLSVLGPSGGDSTVGTLFVTTTDMTGNKPDARHQRHGLKSACNCGLNDCQRFWTEGDCLVEASDLKYTNCFSGTSAATPLVAGVVGIVRSVAWSISPEEIRNLLQDTADKVEDSEAKYGDLSGFSSPTPTDGDPYAGSTHGYGRVNAFEAVRIVAPGVAGGKSRVDLFLRDNRLDWGNTEQPSNVLFESPRASISCWHSMDIKADAPPYAFNAIPSSKEFDQFEEETLKPGMPNRVYVRVRNRGPGTAMHVKVRLYWAYSGTALPALPADFWEGFATNRFTETKTGWHFIGQQPDAGITVPYSGCSAVKASWASISATSDKGQVQVFEWAPGWIPGPAICLLAIVDAPYDHVSPYQKMLEGGTPDEDDFIVDRLTPSDNNVSHHNYIKAIQAHPDTCHFYVRNPWPYAGRFSLRADMPRGWKIDILWNGLVGRIKSPFKLKPGEARLVRAIVRKSKPEASGTVTIYQERILDSSRETGSTAGAKPATSVVGGLTIDFRPSRP